MSEKTRDDTFDVPNSDYFNYDDDVAAPEPVQEEHTPSPEDHNVDVGADQPAAQNSEGWESDWQRSWAERADQFWSDIIDDGAGKKNISDDKSSTDDKVNAVFAALRKETKKATEASASANTSPQAKVQAPSKKHSPREDAVFAALNRLSGTDVQKNESDGKKKLNVPQETKDDGEENLNAPQINRDSGEKKLNAPWTSKGEGEKKLNASRTSKRDKGRKLYVPRKNKEDGEKKSDKPKKNPAGGEDKTYKDKKNKNSGEKRKNGPQTEDEILLAERDKRRSPKSPVKTHLLTALKKTTGSLRKTTKQIKHITQEKAAPTIQMPEKDPVPIGRTLRPDEMLVYDSELDQIDYTDENDLPSIRDYMPIAFSRRGKMGISGGILYGLFVICVSIVLACVVWMFAADVLALNKEEGNAIVTVDAYEPTGDMPTVNDDGNDIKVDISQVSAALKNAGAIEYKWLFEIYAQLSNAEVKIDPGTYSLATDLDYRALVSSMQFGSGAQEETLITFPEGYTMDQIFTLLEEENICKKEDLYEAAANYDFDYDFLDGLELGDASRLEGYLFPDTYYFYKGESAEVAISRFLNNTASKLDGLDDQAASLGMSVRDILIIASIIEKEAGPDDDWNTMASVIYNRLNSGWNLQLDSTLLYVLGDVELTYDDLELDSPYNTYLYSGLPVGPICNPGMDSIEAALNPDITNYWYWYSYEGVTTFFSNDEEFEEFVNSHS